jgi:DeoR/GlpR family transcriptional regulator of sugar metabolism
MFGNKRKKEERLQLIGKLLKKEKKGFSQAELARRLGVSRSTIYKDLAILQEDAGILAAEDEDGRLFWFE